MNSDDYRTLFQNFINEAAGKKGTYAEPRGVKGNREGDWKKLAKKDRPRISKVDVKKYDNLVFEQTILLTRKKTIAWDFDDPDNKERYSKYQLDTDLRAVKGIVIVRIEPDTTITIGEDQERTMITFRFEPGSRDPEEFLKKEVWPGINDITGIVKFRPIGKPVPFEMYTRAKR